MNDLFYVRANLICMVSIPLDDRAIVNYCVREVFLTRTT